MIEEHVAPHRWPSACRGDRLRQHSEVFAIDLSLPVNARTLLVLSHAGSTLRALAQLPRFVAANVNDLRVEGGERIVHDLFTELEKLRVARAGLQALKARLGELLPLFRVEKPLHVPEK